MDDISIDDMNSQNDSAGKLSSNNDVYVNGEYSLWLHTERNLFTVYHGDGDLWDIGSQILDNTRYIKHCSVWCTPKIKHSDEGEQEDVNIMDAETVKSLNKASSFFA